MVLFIEKKALKAVQDWGQQCTAYLTVRQSFWATGPEESGRGRMHSTDKIAILMATYNGEKYICQQIDSILSQTCKDWELYIHDDGSTDNTIAAVESYVEKIPG